MDLSQRSAGVLLHVTSLPGPHGIGDFGPDAYRFVDWLERAGQRLWQWLPTTPIGPGDSPYQSVSAFAGSPLMVALEPLRERGWIEAIALPEGGFDAHVVDFGKVIPWRLEHLRAAEAGFRARGDASDVADFAAWRVGQADWLDDYVLFMALETAHGGQPWWTWAPPLRDRDADALAAARIGHAAEIAFWAFVQWNFDRQCGALKAHANARGIALVGDLPIFIAHHSADCWARPDLYYLDDERQPTVVAGVPPDDLGPLGQRWGNPLYRWDRMADEHYAWWRARVRRALEQADLLRIDHFRGFAGYYEIPASSPTAQEGQWLPGPGQALFDALARDLGEVPILAEDLGLITPDVIALRDGCGFPGMKILQFAFSAGGDHEFLPHNYVPNMAVYSGTHDNDTALGWWDHATPAERRYAGTYLGATREDVHWAMIRAACNSVARFAVFPMQDVLGLESAHRMNLPGTVGSNWRWRFDWPMVGADVAKRLAEAAATSGRAPIGLLHRS
ncbi:MAG: 4-alpha-glucanotransferase [Arenimonas sp.]